MCAWDKDPATSVEQLDRSSLRFALHNERENLMLGRESPRAIFYAPLEVYVQWVLMSLLLISFSGI